MQLKILVSAICYAHYELQSVCKDANWIKLLGIFYNTKGTATVVWKSDRKNLLFLSLWSPFIFERSVETSRSL